MGARVACHLYGEAELGSRHGLKLKGWPLEGRLALGPLSRPLVFFNGRDETPTPPRSSVGCKHLQQINPTTTSDCSKCLARAYWGPSRINLGRIDGNLPLIDSTHGFEVWLSSLFPASSQPKGVLWRL